MLAYGFGAFANNLMAAATGGMMFVLNLWYGVDPRLVGWLGGIPRLLDAFSDPLMGYISDHTQSRWGRRRPYIFVGIIVASVLFLLMWQLPEGRSEGFYFVYFLTLSLIFFVAYTVYATPWVALGYELTPDYHERTRLMGVQNFLGQIPFLFIAPWLLGFMELDRFGGLGPGASILAVLVALICIGFGVVPAIFLRERYMDTSKTPDAPRRITAAIGDFFGGFALTLRNFEFIKLTGSTFLVFNGFNLIAAFQQYVVIYYLFDGNRDDAGILAGWWGTVGSISTIAVIALATYLSSKIGKKQTFFLCIGVSIVGYLLKWLCYSPENPYLLLLCAPLTAFGLGALFTLMASMIADVCDLDELKTGERREGMFGSIYWWFVKLGMSAAAIISGYLLNLSGFDEAFATQSEQTLFLLRVFDVVVPAVLSLLALLLISTYGLSETRCLEIRKQLEERRGTN